MAIEKAQQTKPQIVEYLEGIKPQLQEAATKHLSPDRLIRVFLGEAAKNKALLRCDMASIVSALSVLNSVGLEPGSTLGHAYLIPYGTTCQLQLGYKGLVELARRSGEIARINAAPVYQWELDAGLFEYSHEPPSIRHDWSPNAPEDPAPETIVGAYAVVELRDGQRVQLWLSRAQIEKRRKVSRAKGGPWGDWYAEMARKTVLRAILNGGQVPISTEVSTALAADVDDWARPQEKARPVTRHTMWEVPEREPGGDDEPIDVESEVVP